MKKRKPLAVYLFSLQQKFVHDMGWIQFEATKGSR